MARLKLLIDTDIIIDVLRGVRAAKDLFRFRDIEIFCSILSKKELLSKKGMSNTERKRIENLMAQIKVLRIDNDIASKYQFLLTKYGDKQETIADFVIAATAWSKKLPLLTRNKKHFDNIEEITLSPAYQTEK